MTVAFGSATAVKRRRQAYALLRKPEISKDVAAAEARQLEVNKVSATRTIEENRRIALSDPRSCFNAAGTLKPISEWTGEMAAVVSKIEVVTKNAAASGGCPDTVVKLWFWNKNKALELLFKHLGLMEPEGDDGRPTVPMFLMPSGSRIAIE